MLQAWDSNFYRGRKVMITGGLGFIGSNLARRLVDLEANVLLVDSLIDDYGGNLFNIDGIADRLQVNVADVRQQSTMNYLVRDRAVSDAIRAGVPLLLHAPRSPAARCIESIARKCLGLEYPTAGQIVIIKQRSIESGSPVAGTVDTNNYMAILKRSIAREKG